MVNFLYKHKVFIFLFIILVASGIIYIFSIPPKYISKSHVVIFRPKIETPDTSYEEAKNRWIWIRDGLNQKSAIITDDMLRSIINSNPTAMEYVKQKGNEQFAFEYLKSLINIQYTGADENNFIIEVKAPNAILAYDLNSLAFERIKYLAVQSYQQNFNQILEALTQKQTEYKTDKETYSYYQDKIKKLTFNHILEQKQRENSYEVITRPILNERPIPSQLRTTITIWGLISLTIAFFIEFLICNIRREK